MKKFLEMIEQVKRQDSITILKPAVQQLQKYPDKFKTDLFFHFIEHCQPFVFSPKNKTPETVDGLPVEVSDEWFTAGPDYIPPKVDAPFKIWSAEIAGDNYVTVPKDEVGSPVISIVSFMAVEQEPGDFFYFILAEWPRGDGFKHGENFEREVFITTDMDEVATALVKRLYSEKTGIEPGRMKVKVGSGKSKKFVKISRAIHIRPKKLVSVDTRSESGAEIDWSHRWTVRGCWVDLGPGRVGKDRDGNYCVDGKTWRVEHIKGPENMPLIKKTRIVEKGNGDERPS